MGYNLNVQAYELFLKIEVGLREFLIKSIRKLNVNEWATSFLGSLQRETLSSVVTRINAATLKGEQAEINDTYFYKLSRAQKEPMFYSLELYHPFYYLNWTDLENLMRIKQNTIIIDSLIGKLNRETITDVLRPLNSIRNDVAHSRFISETNFKILKSSFESIAALIPEFENLVNNQTREGTIEVLIGDIKDVIKIAAQENVLSIEEIERCQNVLLACENSFWLNSLKIDLVKAAKELRIALAEYSSLRIQQGGLLEIQYLKPKITVLVDNLNKILDGKI